MKTPTFLTSFSHRKLLLWLVVPAMATLLTAGACGESETDNPATGGASMKTGGQGTGGNRTGGSGPSTGGAGGTGGSPTSSGGAPSTGGAGETGGTATGGRGDAGSAGSTGGSGTGGSAASGGASAGTGGHGGAPAGGRGGSGGGATGGSAGSPGSTGGSGAYQPCHASPCKILPLGDSITWGVGDEGNAGYRGALFALAVAAGQKITFTGSLSNGPTTVSGQAFPKSNEGHSGWGVSRVNPNSGGGKGIATLIPSPALTTGGTPDIILLHIGTNDLGFFSATQTLGDLTGLIDSLITNAPNALLVVAQIIPLGYGDNKATQDYNKGIPALVQQRAAAGKHIMLVDQYDGFTASSMIGSDLVHPNHAGYQAMANKWYAAIGPLLPK